MMRILVFIALVGAMSCKSEPSSEVRLIGGDVTDDSTLASFLSIPSCSGVLVQPDVIMTAAHCIHDFSTTGRISSQYRSGSSIRIGNSKQVGGSVRVRIKESFVHPSWSEACSPQQLCDPNRAGAGNDPSVVDLAVIQLETEVTSIPHAEVDFSSVNVGDDIVVAGYGCESGINTGGYGNRKAMTTKAVDGTTFLAHRGSERADFIKETISSNFVTPGYDDGGPGLCPGDSGGPVYRKGTNKLVGINADYTFVGSYEQTGAIPKTNIHAKFDDPKISDWLRPLVRKEVESANEVYLLAHKLTQAGEGTNATALYASVDESVKSLSLCPGESESCFGATDFSFVTLKEGRNFFRSAPEFALTAGAYTVVAKDKDGETLLAKSFDIKRK